MNNNGFAKTQTNVEIPKDIGEAEKPLKSNIITSKRVDINVLKSKLQQSESKEFKKNLYILSVLVILLSSLGIYLSL